MLMQMEGTHVYQEHLICPMEMKTVRLIAKQIVKHLLIQLVHMFIILWPKNYVKSIHVMNALEDGK